MVGDHSSSLEEKGTFMSTHQLHRRRLIPLLTMVIITLFVPLGMLVFAGDLQSRVPPDQLEEAQSLKNPFTVSKEFVDQGRMLYEGRAFCSACHGRDGRGMPTDSDQRSSATPMPRNFTDGAWQAARSDGEIFWILKHGSHGTDMASFLAQYVSEKEAWQLVTYLRSFQGA